MAAKPTNLPRWANVGGAIVTPASGKLDIGWVPGERPPAQYDNWHKNLVFQWMQYLSDAAFSGPASFDSTLGVTGLLTATGGVTAAAGKHIQVSGAGLFKHGVKTMSIPIPIGTNGIFAGSGATAHPVEVLTIPAGNSLGVLITVVPVGARVVAIRAIILDGNAGNTVSLVFYKKDSSIGQTWATNDAWKATSAGTGVGQTLAVNAINYTAAATTEMLIVVAGSNAVTQVWTIELDYDQP